jgi:hypothetical protein
MSSWPGMCWAGDKGAFQTRSTCHHFRRISQQLGKWLMYTPAYAFPWSGSRLMGARLLAFEIWTQTRHPPVGGMLRTQQRLSVLLDCALPGFFTKRFASRRGSKANNGKYRRIRPGQHRSSRQHHSTNNVNKTVECGLCSERSSTPSGAPALAPPATAAVRTENETSNAIYLCRHRESTPWPHG